jgi:hypothetical protein
MLAGFDPERCVAIFDVLEDEMLDYGDLDGVFGPDDMAPEPKGALGGWVNQARRWGWERLRGYPSLRERREVLELRLAEYRRKTT